MLFSRADIDALRLCAWCKDLPAPICRNVPADILDWLEELSFIRRAESGPSFRMTPRGMALLEQIGFSVEADGQYRSGDVLRRRLQTAEITAFFWRMAANVFYESPRAETCTGSFLPSFALRRKEMTNVLGGSRLCGFYYTDHTVFIPYYVSPDNEGIYPAVEQRTFRAEILSLRRTPHVLYTGDGSLEDLLSLVQKEPVKKEKRTTDSFWSAIPKLNCPVAILPMNEDGMRQLRILAAPGYKERLLRAVLGQDYLPPFLTQSDGRSKSTRTTYVVGFDCNMARFEEVLQHCEEEPHIILLSTQFEAVAPYFHGKNAAVSAVDIADVEHLLGIPQELPSVPMEAFITEKGEYVYVPPIREIEGAGRKGRSTRRKT